MATALLERVPVDEIGAQARDARPGRAVLTVIAAVFFALGWCAARAVLCVAWCCVAVREGWREGRRGGAVNRGAA
jgi:hypothetical protein